MEIAMADDIIARAAELSLAKIARSRALSAPYGAAEPVATGGWTLPDGDRMVKVTGGVPARGGGLDISQPFYVRLRTHATSAIQATVSGAVVDSSGWVQHDAGRPLILPAATAGGEDAASALSTAERVAVSSAAAISIYKALSAMQSPANIALGLR